MRSRVPPSVSSNVSRNWLVLAETSAGSQVKSSTVTACFLCFLCSVWDSLVLIHLQRWQWCLCRPSLCLCSIFSNAKHSGKSWTICTVIYFIVAAVVLRLNQNCCKNRQTVLFLCTVSPLKHVYLFQSRRVGVFFCEPKRNSFIALCCHCIHFLLFFCISPISQNQAHMWAALVE